MTTPTEPQEPQTRRARRRARPGAGPADRAIVTWLQKDHPLLREFIQTMAPILMSFLGSQLPTLLNGITNALTEDDDDDAQP